MNEQPISSNIWLVQQRPKRCRPPEPCLNILSSSSHCQKISVFAQHTVAIRPFRSVLVLRHDCGPVISFLDSGGMAAYWSVKLTHW